MEYIFCSFIQYISQAQMNYSLLRMVAGYSRLAFQEERKHQNILGTLYQQGSYKKYWTHHQPLESFERPSQSASSSQKLKIPNYMRNLYELDLNQALVDLNLDLKLENSTNTIQYSANNGIEDRLVAAKLKTLDADTISVFDGHGGDKLSDYCANHVVDLIDGYLQVNLKKQQYANNHDALIVDALNFAYARLEKDFYENIYTPLAGLNNRKIRNVGTCALTIVIYNKKIYVANCGDSQAILVSQTPQNQIKYTELNQRLSVNNEAERQRLRKEFPDDSDIVVYQNQCSFYIKGRLQPTRSIGDYYLKYEHLFKGKGKFNGPYVKSQPEIKIFQLTNQSKSIVIGSDGLWDFGDKQEIAEASLSQNPHEQILEQAMYKIARVHNRSIDWIKEVDASEKRSFHDDISIGVISLGSLSKPESAST